MFKRVDSDKQDEVIEGFSYNNADGDVESVTIPDGVGERSVVNISTDAGNENIYVYHNDIPNLIKALRASYNFKGE